MIRYKENSFEISENRVNGLSEMDINDRFKAIINCDVVEKTKSYTIVRVKHMVIIKTKRIL